MRHKKKNWIPIVVVSVFLLWTIIPILLMFQQSVKPNLIMFSDPPQYIFKPTLLHYTKIFAKNNILENMRNSIIVGGITTLLCVLMGSTCAYVLARVNLPGKKIWAFIIIVTRMVPVGALMMPLYVIMRKIGLANTHAAVILAHTTLNLPFAVWLMRSFFQDIPIDLEQAAKVDGCSPLKTFLLISLPLAKPGIVTAAIMTMLSSWNEFMFALILSGKNARTLPVGISAFVGSISIDWGGSSAAATLATIPVFIAGVYIQKHLVRGLTAGAIKG